MSAIETPVRAVCVFCGSATGVRPEYAEAARQMGSALSRRRLDVVYGAGNIGLMGVLADAALAGGGRVVGVIPRSLVARELAHAGLSELHVVETMHERKALMADKSDAFAALPGGFGTADELFEILTWAQLGIHQKPVGLLNVAGCFAPLLAWMDRLVDDGLLKPAHRALPLVADDPGQLLERLRRHRPAPAAPKIAPSDR